MARDEKPKEREDRLVPVIVTSPSAGTIVSTGSQLAISWSQYNKPVDITLFTVADVLIVCILWR